MSLSHDSNPHIPMNAQPIAQPQMQFQQQQFQQQPAAAASNSLLPDNNRYFEERAAIPANHQLSEEERWRLQEEKWAKDEQARYGLPSSVNAAMGSSEAEMREPFPSPMSNNTSLRTHPSAFAANNNFNGIPDDSAPLDAERFGKLRTYYDRSGQPMQQQMSNPNSNDAMMRAEQFNQQQTIPNADLLRADNLNANPKMAPSISNSAVSVNASTRSLVNEDGIAPYSNKDTTIASTLRANKNYDDRIIAEHDVIMAAEGERYNAIAAATGHQARIDDSADMKAEPGLVSPTAYLDDAQIMEEKAKQAELERRIAERNSQYADRVKDQEFQEEHAKELGIIPGAGAAAAATVPLKQGEFINSADNDQQQQHWDENAPSDNFVTMGKTRNSKLNAAGRTPAAQRAHDLQVRQSAGLPEETEEMRIKREKSPKETLNAVKAALVAGHPKIEDAIPLGAQLYTGNPPKSIQPILDDTPDLWFDQYRRDTAERRSKKETLRRVDLNRKEKETQGSVTTRIAAVFDDTKASIKRSKQEHDLKAEDRKMTNFNQKAKERMSKYFRVHGNERFVCAFDCQALHNHQPISGHAILTEQTLCFVGKGQEDFEVLDNKANTADPHAPVSTVHRRENILVKEIIPLGNIASITMGTVVKNNGKVFIMDAADDLIVADAIQLFCKDGRVVQLRSFSHPCVTQKGKSYDGRIVPSIHRFLNFLDHNWRANGSFIPQNNTNANNNIRE